VARPAERGWGRNARATRDPDDNRILEAAAAAAGRADVIVSGDDDLLSLGNYEGILIVSPVAFLLMLQEAPTGPVVARPSGARIRIGA
jgi:predicted nucleic acid-binding protein